MRPNILMALMFILLALASYFTGTILNQLWIGIFLGSGVTILLGEIFK